MRRLLVVFFVLACTLVLDVASVNADTSCPPQAPGTKVQQDTISSADAAKATTQKMLSSADLCSDEAVSITKGLISATVKDWITRQCSAKDKQSGTYGCKPGQQQPKVCILLDNGENKTVITLSKCDKSKLQSAFNASIDSGSVQPLMDLASSQQTTIDFSARSQAPTVGGVNGSEQLAQELSVGAGISLGDAQKIVNADPVAALNAINAISQGGKDAVPQSLAGVTLNPDLADPESMRQIIAQTNNLPTDPSQQTPVTTDPNSTIAAGNQSNIAQALAAMCDQGGMGGCGYACNGSQSLTCRTNNPGAIVCSSIATRFGAIGCDPNNNTAVFPTIEAGIAAQANLLTTSSRYFASGGNTILGAFCNGYSTSNCGEYAQFISSQTGIPINQTIDPNNAQQIGAIMMASSRFENGRGVIYTPDQLQTGLLAGYGMGSLPEGTPGYTPSSIAGTNGGYQFCSPYDFSCSTAPPSIAGAYGSPYASAVPVGYATAPTYQSYTPIQSAPQSLAPVQQPASQAPQVQQGQPVATLIVQPTTTTRGGIVTVSWSSVGMRTDMPCTLTMGSTTLAQANEGSQRVPAPGTSESLSFSLACQSTVGTSITQSASVTVQ